VGVEGRAAGWQVPSELLWVKENRLDWGVVGSVGRIGIPVTGVAFGNAKVHVLVARAVMARGVLVRFHLLVRP
jgi:hypothetical protein